MKITCDDLKFLPHIVILQNEKGTTIYTFTGPDAQEKAFACSTSGFDGCVTVAVRIRQTCVNGKLNLLTT